MKNTVLIKPVVSEKGEILSEQSQYVFVVNKNANKLEIQQAVEDMYSVTVEQVRTLIMPGKRKVRNTRSGFRVGRISPFKKAIVKLSEGEEIDFFSE